MVPGMEVFLDTSQQHDLCTQIEGVWKSLAEKTLFSFGCDAAGQKHITISEPRKIAGW